MKLGLITLVTACILSCNTNPEHKLSKDFRIILTTDSPNYFYGPVINAGNELGLNPLNKGVDSFELRVWSGRMTLPENLFSIKFENGNWIATSTELWLKRDANGKDTGATWFKAHKYIGDSCKSYHFPYRDYANFIDSVILLNLKDLPRQTKENFLDHPTFYTIEIATKNFYKFVSYDTPYIHELFSQSDQKPDSNNLIFTNLLHLIDSHFYQDAGFQKWYKENFALSQ
jgi:hypothetical protein